MVEHDKAKSRQTRLRLRELAQYYSSTLSLPASDFGPHRDADGTIRPYDLADFQPYSPDVSKDPSLTAIAQLATHRLDCQRSFISLIGESAQHVVAEATKTVSPFDKDNFKGDDAIILGAQSIPLTFGICTTTISVFTGKCEFTFGPETAVGKDYICIPDLLAENTTSSLPALQALPPILRFYLEVPLKSEAGYVIGSICVMDPTVRKATPYDVEVMHDMAKLVMRHLDFTRMKHDHRKAERLLEGLGHFIKGKDSILGWTKLTAERGEIQTAAPHHPEPFLNGTLPSEQDKSSSDVEHRPFSPLHNPEHTRDGATKVDPPLDSPSIAPPLRNESASQNTELEIGFDPSSGPSAVDSEFSATPADLQVRQTFSRAANLIREGMDLDASCFVAIPQDERYKSVKSCRESRKSKVDVTDPNLSLQSSSESSYDSDHELKPPKPDKSPTSSSGMRSDVLCHRLGFSTRVKSSLAGTAITGTYLTIPTALLSRLSLRYPEGRIFHFDSVGSISSGSDEQQGTENQKAGSSRHRTLSAKLLQYFPTAKSLMFFPIYNEDKQHVYAAYFGFTTNTARGIQKSELTYVSGFANSIMCEVMRLKAEATDKAKSDFISSISHELRSPLHGILASSQLLSESQILPKQVEFLEMIDTCARSLLDIMNHLLDHAKINHFTKRKDPTKSQSQFKLKRADSRTYSLVTELNLLAVVEETAASMVAGNSHNSWQSRGVGVNNTLRKPSMPMDIEQWNVPLILNVAPQKHWTFMSEAGSWRRIVMNLIGNSLKYTQQGHISVNLSVQSTPKSGDKKVAELKVSDTGQGISPEYLKHKLYTPFAQENNLSVGAGLGLSLVRKIVSSLDGNIQINSEIGVGTDVVVTIPLDQCDSTVDHDTGTSEEQIKAPINGLTFKLVGFDDLPSSIEQPSSTSFSRNNASLAMKESLISILEGWMQTKLSYEKADILVIEESCLERELKTYDTIDNSLLVIGLNGRSGTTDRIKFANFVYVVPPMGPLRMTQALKTLFEEKERRLTDARSAIDHDQRMNVTNTQPPPSDQLHLAPSTALSKQGESEQRIDLGTGVTPVIAAPDDISPITDSSSSISSTTKHEEVSIESKKAILLVDDNIINLRILSTAISRLDLEAQGFHIITAINGLEALNAYIAAANAGTHVPIILMDISMPVMDGFTATREIRAFEAAKCVKDELRSTIIAVTGLASAEAQKEVENSGFDVYLRKPVGLKAVRQIVTSYAAKAVS